MHTKLNTEDYLQAAVIRLKERPINLKQCSAALISAQQNFPVDGPDEIRLTLEGLQIRDLTITVDDVAEMIREIHQAEERVKRWRQTRQLTVKETAYSQDDRPPEDTATFDKDDTTSDPDQTPVAPPAREDTNEEHSVRHTRRWGCIFLGIVFLLASIGGGAIGMKTLQTWQNSHPIKQTASTGKLGFEGARYPPVEISAPFQGNRPGIEVLEDRTFVWKSDASGRTHLTTIIASLKPDKDGNLRYADGPREGQLIDAACIDEDLEHCPKVLRKH